MLVEESLVRTQASIESMVLQDRQLFQRLGFTKSDADSNMYFKVMENYPLILVLYVDDLFLTGAKHQTTRCKRELTSEFEMKDLGLMHYFWV